MPLNHYVTLGHSGLRVSQSVRTPAECVELHDRNMELNVSLLDVRFLVGSEPNFAWDAFVGELMAYLDGLGVKTLK